MWVDPSCVPQPIRLHSLSYLQSERLAAIKKQTRSRCVSLHAPSGFYNYGGLFLPQLKTKQKNNNTAVSQSLRLLSQNFNVTQSVTLFS